MRKVVNIYIVLFFLDSLVSLADVLIGRPFGVQPLSIIQLALGVIVLLMSFPIYFFIGCLHGFRKRMAVPLMAFSFWSGLFAGLPLPIFLGMEKTRFVLSFIQLFVFIAAIVVFRFSGRNNNWLYHAPAFERTYFRWKRLLGFMAVNMFMVVPLICVYLAFSLSMAVSHLSRNFLQISLSGISVEARTYLYEGKKIFLLPTAHIAQDGFYEKSIALLPVENTVVLPEGVTDENQLLRDGLNYEGMADILGLEAQDNRIFIADRQFKHCDVDVSEFSEDTIAFIRNSADFYRLWASGDRELAWRQMAAAPQIAPRLLIEELLDYRNHRVTDCIDDCLQTYDNIVIPWGAAHMPGIENAILEWGGTVSERRKIQVWGWSSCNRLFFLLLLF